MLCTSEGLHCFSFFSGEISVLKELTLLPFAPEATFGYLIPTWFLGFERWQNTQVTLIVLEVDLYLVLVTVWSFAVANRLFFWFIFQ